MFRRSIPLCFLLASIGVYALDALYHLPRLPERVATHFGPTGTPDGWMTKEAFIISGFILLILVTGVQAGGARFVGTLPNDLINLPNKDFWLAPERRERTLAVLADQLLIFGVATNILLVAIYHQIFRTNLTPTPHMGSVAWLLLGAYLAYTAVWTVGLIRRFRRP